VEQGHRLALPHTNGNRDQRLRRHQRLLGVTPRRPNRQALTIPLTGAGNHLPANPTGVDSAANRAHHAGHTRTGHVRRPHGEEVLAPAAADQGVKKHHVSCRDVDQRLARSHHQIRCGCWHQHLGAAELRYLHYPHAETPSGR